MTNQDSGSPSLPATHGIVTDFRFVGKPQASATRRRLGLQGALALYRLTPTELARRAGLPNANLIFNFLNGRTDALALETVERILTALPGLRFEQLVGWTAYHEIADLVADQVQRSSDEPASADGQAADVVMTEAVAINGRLSLRGAAEVPSGWNRPGEPLRLKIALILEH